MRPRVTPLSGKLRMRSLLHSKAPGPFSSFYAVARIGSFIWRSTNDPMISHDFEPV